MKKRKRMLPYAHEMAGIYATIYSNHKRDTSIELCALPGEPLCPELDVKDLARMILLLTYCNEERKVVIPSNEEYASKKDILFLLNGSYKTESEAFDRLIASEKLVAVDGLYVVTAVNNDAYKHPRKQHIYYLKKSVIQSSYIATHELHGGKVQMKAMLGHMLRLIPYTNFYYNILCKNPKECSLQKIEPLSKEEICRIAGIKEYVQKIPESELTIRTIEGDYEMLRECQTEYGQDVYVMNPELCQTSETHWSIYTLRNGWKWNPFVYDIDYIEPISLEEELTNAEDSECIQGDATFWDDEREILEYYDPSFGW